MRQEKVIWIALVFSTFVYAMIIYALYPHPEGAFEEAVQRPMVMAVYGFALAEFVLGLVLPSFLRMPSRTKMIVSMAVFESCVIFGLMGAFLSRDWRVFVPTWILGLLGMWRMYPSGENAVSV